MTKMLTLALVLLVSAAWLQAQEQYPQTGSSQSEATASGQITVQGCLQGSNGNYTLTDNSGTTYQLQGDTSKLSAHIGHEVQITGSTSSSSAASSSTSTAAAGAQQPTLTVQKMKHISETCKSASK
jgi:DNA polymerase III alpha subunit